jgi:hypothetical protein
VIGTQKKLPGVNHEIPATSSEVWAAICASSSEEAPSTAPLGWASVVYKRRGLVRHLVGIYAALADIGRASVLKQFGNAQFPRSRRR